jgi:lysophospholipase L1-like esterase
MGLAISSLMPFSTKAHMKSKKVNDPVGTTILFQGDSITDAGRDRASYYANNLRGLGNGYAILAAAKVLADDPKTNYQVYNRGISGNKVYQLSDRWKDDCLNLKPDILSILIGVNDIWHTLSGRFDSTAEKYEKDYHALLTRTKNALPDVKLIIGEPFVVDGGTAIDNDKWFPKFEGYRIAAKRIAEEFKAAFIPYQTIFAEALKTAPVAYWCPDGVHPSLAGAQLMADAWFKAFKSL